MNTAKKHLFAIDAMDGLEHVELEVIDERPDNTMVGLECTFTGCTSGAGASGPY